MIWFGGVYGISTIVGHLMPNPLYIYWFELRVYIYDLLYIYWFELRVYIYDLLCFYGISIMVGYLIPNPRCTYILNIYDLVLFCFMIYQPL